jgi:hypothetical protein
MDLLKLMLSTELDSLRLARAPNPSQSGDASQVPSSNDNTLLEFCAFGYTAALAVDLL